MTFKKIWGNWYHLESVLVKIGKRYEIGIDEKSVSVTECYLILKIVFGKVKIFEIVKNRCRQ